MDYFKLLFSNEVFVPDNICFKGILYLLWGQNVLLHHYGLAVSNQ